MDFSSIFEFIDLVKNPDKYSAALASLDSKITQINELSAAYGDLSKAKDLRDAAELALSRARQEVDSMKQAQISAEKVRKDLLDAEFAKIGERESAVNARVYEAQQKLDEAKTLVNGFQVREKQLSESIKRNADLSEELNVKLAEVNAKLEKLRGVMA